MLVKAKKGDRTVQVEYDFGQNLQEAIQKFGEDVIFTKFVQAAKIDLQAVLRRGIEAGKTDDEIAKLAEQWKPGLVVRTSKDPIEAIKAKLATLSEEDKRKLIQVLRQG